MSWLSTFIHNNHAAISGAVGFLPGGSAISGVLNIVDPMSKTAAMTHPTVKSLSLMQGLPTPQGVLRGAQRQQGPPPRTSSSTIRVGGVPVFSQHDTTTGGGVQGSPGTAMVCGQRGYHLAKTKKLREQGICVRNRHMNPGNGRAVKRAVRRLRAFHKLAVRVERSLHIGRATSHRGRTRAAGCSCGCKR